LNMKEKDIIDSFMAIRPRPNKNKK
jgi:hypothetical protein